MVTVALASVTVLVAESLIYTFPLTASAVNVATLVLNGVTVLVDVVYPMLPFKESRAKAGVVIIPVNAPLLISLLAIMAARVVAVTFPPILNPPALDSSITLLPDTLFPVVVVKFVVAELAASTLYVPVVAVEEVSAVLTKFNTVPEPLVTVALAKVTVLVTESLTYTFPLTASAVNVATLVLNGVTVLVDVVYPMLPFNESKAKAGVVIVPVKAPLLMSLYAIMAACVVAVTFPPILNPPALDSSITLLPDMLFPEVVVKFVVAELAASTLYVPVVAVEEVSAVLTKFNTVPEPLVTVALDTRRQQRQ